MLYSILIYGIEGVFDRLSEEEQEKVLARHRAVQADLNARSALALTAKLMGTESAVTVRSRADNTVVTDGPFAETKEQMLGIYLVECATIDEAIDVAKALPGGISSYEVRPVSWSNLETDAL